MDNILITGISGFVGTYLNKVLSLESNVIGMSIRGGVIDKQLPACDTIVHLAGKAHDLVNTSNATQYHLVNTVYTKQLFDKFLMSNATTFIFISSVKAIADKVEGILTETDKASPSTPYGISKMKAEQYLLSKVLPEHKRLYILRPCMIHGPQNKGNLNLLYSLVKKGIPYPLGAYENQRSFLHINNLVTIIQQLIINKPKSDVFNVADDTPISTKKLVSLIYLSLDKRSKIIYIPKIIISILCNIGTILTLPINKEKLSKLTENYVVSNAKVKKALNIKTEFSTTKGLIETLESFKNI